MHASRSVMARGEDRRHTGPELLHLRQPDSPVYMASLHLVIWSNDPRFLDACIKTAGRRVKSKSRQTSSAHRTYPPYDSPAPTWPFPLMQSGQVVLIVDIDASVQFTPARKDIKEWEQPSGLRISWQPNRASASCSPIHTSTFTISYLYTFIISNTLK